MQFDVFISYAHQDKTVADAACAILEAEGTRCWMAPRDVLPGKDWGEAIVEAIANAKVMVLIFSGFANGSVQIKREVERAVNKGIPILPVRIEEIVPSRTLEYFLSVPHWLDAFPPPLEQHLRRLSFSVQSLLNPQSTPPPLPFMEAQESRSQSSEYFGKPRAIVDRFFRTFLYAWHKPSKFLVELKRDPEAFLSPYQFFVASLGLIFLMTLTNISLSLTIADGPAPDPKALSAGMMIMLVLLVGFNTLFYQALGKIWPVRGTSTLSSMFSLQCYYVALALPMFALNVLVQPGVLALVKNEIAPTWTMAVPVAVGWLVGVIYFCFYMLPAVAFVNGVRVRRLVAGLALWILICSLVGGVVGAIIAIMLDR
jgi:hypothetical protein